MEESQDQVKAGASSQLSTTIIGVLGTINDPE